MKRLLLILFSLVFVQNLKTLPTYLNLSVSATTGFLAAIFPKDQIFDPNTQVPNFWAGMILNNLIQLSISDIDSEELVSLYLCLAYFNALYILSNMAGRGSKALILKTIGLLKSAITRNNLKQSTKELVFKNNKLF